MRTIFFPVAAILAASVSANRGDPLPAGFIEDLEEPIGDKSHCCFLYSHADYQYDPLSIGEQDGYDRNYTKKEFCVTKNFFGENKISPYSFLDSNA